MCLCARGGSLLRARNVMGQQRQGCKQRLPIILCGADLTGPHRPPQDHKLGGPETERGVCGDGADGLSVDSL